MIKIYVGDEEIGQTESVASIPEVEDKMFEFYMRRKNYYYFRGAEGRIRVESDQLSDQLRGLRLGDMVNISWSAS